MLSSTKRSTFNSFALHLGSALERHEARIAKEKEQKPLLVKKEAIEKQHAKISEQLIKIKNLSTDKNLKKSILKRELHSLEKKFRGLNEKNDLLINSQVHNQNLIFELYEKIKSMQEKHEEETDDNEKKIGEFEKKLDRYILNKYDKGDADVIAEPEKKEPIALVKENIKVLEQKVSELKLKHFDANQIKLFEERLSLAKEKLHQLENPEIEAKPIPKQQPIPVKEPENIGDDDLDFLKDIPAEEQPEDVPEGRPLKLSPPGPMPLSTDIGEPDEPMPEMNMDEIMLKRKVKIPQPKNLSKKPSFFAGLFKKKK